MQTGLLDSARATRAAAQPRSGPDRCPTTTELHRADDGLIARVRVPGGRMTAEQARTIAAHAAADDRIELTSRGNLQLRGLEDDAAARATKAFAAVGLVPSPAHERARTIVASPFIGRRPGAGLDDAFIAALDQAICELDATRAVSGRVLTVVDDGSGHTLAGEADLLVRWRADLDAVQLVLGGVEAAVVARAAAPRVAAALLASFATAAAAHVVWRARELPPVALAELTGAAATETPDEAVPGPGGDLARAPRSTTAAPQPISPELGVGVVAQIDGMVAARVIAPLGRLTSAQFAGAAEIAVASGTDLRIDTARGLTLVDLASDEPPAERRASATEVLAALAALGLITDPSDPTIGLTACAGLACSRTDVDVRAAARLRAAARRPGDPREHLVGCERRCGAPTAGRTVVAAPGDTPEQLAARGALASTDVAAAPATADASGAGGAAAEDARRQPAPTASETAR